MANRAQIVLFALSFAAPCAAVSADREWRDYGGDASRTCFSGASQIRKENVRNLRVAWTYHAGGRSDALKSSMECNPLIVRGVMYVTSPVLEVIALDAETGREIWKYNPFPERPSYTRLWAAVALLWALLLAGAVMLRRFVSRRRVRPIATPSCQFHAWLLATVFLLAGGSGLPGRWIGAAMRHILPDPMREQKHSGPSRGVTYWEDGLDRRILFAGGHKLIALDARTGAPMPGFGKSGVIDLTEGLGRNIDGLGFTVTSPGVVYKDLVIVGSMVGEGPEPAAPGHVRAYDVRTGEQRWIFHTIPQPGETGYDTWPAGAWETVGGSNAWGGMTVDGERGLVFVPLGSATFDFYGGDRAGKNLFSDCLVALRADDGKLVWYYQMVHHDLWDYDLASAPTLATIRHNGKPMDVVVEATKNGFVFVLDRDTGKPAFPVEERPVPASSLEGEQAWPTQPVPVKPAALSRMEIAESDLTDLSPQAHASALLKFQEIAGAGMFAPPSKRGTILIPGLHGGANWGGASLDPRTGRLVVNTNDIPYLLEIVDAKPGSGFRYGFRGFNRFVDDQGYPAVKPPWGRLTSIDLNSGEIVWQEPFGEYKELTARGLPVTGAENAGGSIITASGLVFIAATKDRMFRAFDIDTGKILWQTELHAAGHATPATYEVKGRQYVVIAAGGGSMVESPSGDEYVAFALSDPQ
ncbi:MAG: pyrroloquinoline quinone-dependent dehydrogenase [Bryobacteraceae bacterium]